ncbi:DnaB-like helicase C-terminal domain-containing protein [Nocardia sp. CY41]|uniref:DnaB-like helicase C-terminal domain-containing protein n=1 Tax=Nocardia sp. CY41 TaxID=2608686 RepID=UPI001358B4B4|nr:DnaB-like helicase C-terminal domain-containing protein [Nocardia sp. CY41]
MIAFQRIVDAFRAQGLNVKDNGHGRAAAQAPGHSAADLSVSIRDIGEQVLLHSHSDPTDVVLEAVGLTLADLFDTPRGATYEYPDNRTVYRTPSKQFRQSGNTHGNSLFRVDTLANASIVYVAEGEKDVLALESAGAVATCTAMGAGKAHLFDLTPLHGKQVRIIRDMDAPGKAHAAQLVELLDGHAEVTVWEPATGKDAADHIAAGFTLDDFKQSHSFQKPPLVIMLEKALAAAQELPANDVIATLHRQLAAFTAAEQPDHLRDFVDLIPEWMEWVTAPPEMVRTIASPWPEVDEVLNGGIQPGKSYLFAGRPGGGKSLALTNYAAYAGMRGYRGLLVSVEMGAMEIMSRIMADRSRTSYSHITQRRLDDFELGRVSEFATDAHDVKLKICTKTPITVDEIHDIARRIKHTEGLDFVAVDYVQLLKASTKSMPRQEQIADISRNLKVMAGDLDVALISACQLNRGAAKDKRPPELSDLRESGALEQDSDTVILIHHPQINDQPTGDVEFHIKKNRDGRESIVTLDWQAHQARIASRGQA